MGKIRPVVPVKLFVSVITSLPSVVPEVQAKLAALLGPVDLRSETFPFDSTHYYDREMGSPLLRSFFGYAGRRPSRPSVWAGSRAGCVSRTDSSPSAAGPPI